MRNILYYIYYASIGIDRKQHGPRTLIPASGCVAASCHYHRFSASSRRVPINQLPAWTCWRLRPAGPRSPCCLASALTCVKGCRLVSKHTHGYVACSFSAWAHRTRSSTFYFSLFLSDDVTHGLNFIMELRFLLAVLIHSFVASHPTDLIVVTPNYNERREIYCTLQPFEKSSEIILFVNPL